MNEIKVSDEDTRRTAEVLYQYSRKCYKAGARDALLGTTVVLAGAAIGHLTVTIVKYIKKRSKKTDEQE